MSGGDGLREALARTLLAATTDYGTGKAAPDVDLFDFYADAVLALPEFTAYVNRRAQERAAAMLADVLAEECRNVHPAVRDALADRADALAPPDGGWAWRRTATGWASDAPAADDQAGQR